MKPFKWSIAAMIALVSSLGTSVLAQPVPSGLRWVAVSNGVIPQNAVKGGYESDGRPFYICRASYLGGIHPGKIKQDFRDCTIGYGGVEVQSQAYEVLVNPAVVMGGNITGGNITGQGFVPHQNVAPPMHNLVSEVHALANSVPDNPFGLFLEDWERNQLRDSALRVQQLAIAAGCFPVADQANQFAQDILTVFMDRNGARTRLNQIRTQAQACG